MLAIGETMSITKLHEHFSKTPHNTTPTRMLFWVLVLIVCLLLVLWLVMLCRNAASSETPERLSHLNSSGCPLSSRLNVYAYVFIGLIR